MLGGIAGISLLVGGIGIMNIMLASVTERTREIDSKGHRAKRKNILLQFLIESIVISGMGGLLTGAGYLLMRLLEDMLGMTLTMSAGVAELAPVLDGGRRDLRSVPG